MEHTYQVIGYMRIEPDEPQLLTYTEAVRELENVEAMYPDGDMLFRIEKVD